MTMAMIIGMMIERHDDDDDDNDDNDKRVLIQVVLTIVHGLCPWR